MKNILIILVVLSLFTACGGTETEELAKKNKATIDSLQQIAN